MQDNTCCFFGHRKIDDTAELRNKICEAVEMLIVKENIDTFLFGSKSQFNSLCHKLVTEIKTRYPHIKRVFVRAEYPVIDDGYRDYLLKDYEDTYYPKCIINSGKAVYIERNCEIIDRSRICIVYYNPDYQPPQRKEGNNMLKSHTKKSGTKIAYDYAVRKNKSIININE